MSLPVKLGVGTLALGSAFGLGYGAVNYFSQQSKETREGKSIKSLIDEKFDYVLLSFAKTDNPDEVIWKQNWETYKKENLDKDTDILGVKGWSKDTSSESTEELKERCKELSEKIVYDKGAANYESVTKYCGREAKAGDEAIKNNLTIIDGETADKWNTKTTKKDKLKGHLEKLSISDDDLSKPATLKQKCDTARNKTRKSEGYTAIYEAYKFICTNHPIQE